MAPLSENYDMLGNLITEPATTYNLTSAQSQPTTVPITTLAPTSPTVLTVPQLPGIVHLNVFVRYPTLNALFKRFSPLGLQIDKFFTASWAPLGIVGLILASAIFLNWNIRSKEKRAKRSATLSIIPHLIVYSLLQLALTAFIVVDDLDGVWDTRLLTWTRVACPLFHGLKTSCRIAVAISTIFIGWRGFIVSKSMQLFRKEITEDDNHRSKGCWRWVKQLGVFLTGGVTSATFIIIASLIVGMVNIAFWEVNLEREEVHDVFETSSSSNEFFPRLQCELVGGYQTRFQISMKPPNSLFAFAPFNQIIYFVIFLPAVIVSIAFAVLLCQRCRSRRGVWMTNGAEMIPVYVNSSKRPTGMDTVRLSCGVCALYGALRLPEVVLVLLAQISIPSENEVSDKEITSNANWHLFFQHFTAIRITSELADSSTGFFLLMSLVVSRRFRRRCLTLLRLDSRCRQSASRALSIGRERMQSFKVCASPKKRRDHSPRRKFQHRAPTWSWGKGWQYPSQTLSLPDQYHERQRPMDTAPTRQSLGRGLDPDHLDSIVGRHNAYAESLTHDDADAVESFQKNESSRRYIKNNRGSHQWGQRNYCEAESNFL